MNGSPTRLWHCWEIAQQSLKEVIEMRPCSSQTPSQGNDSISQCYSHGHWPGRYPTFGRIHRNWKRGTKPTSANWDHQTCSAYTINASSVGRGDPPTSITGKLPSLLGKSKPRQRSWQISDLEFQNTLQVPRGVHPANRTGKQHVIISSMRKQEK